MVEAQKNSRCFAFLRRADEPSVGIGVVEVQKLEVFCDSCGARATPLRGSAWSRCKNSRFFFCVFAVRGRTLCGDRRGRGARSQDFLRFCGARMNPLRGSAWSRFSVFSRFFAILAVPARPSAGIGMVEVQKLEVVFRVFACRRALAVAPCKFVFVSANPLRRTCVKALLLWRRAILLLAKWPLEVVSWFARLLSQSRGRGFDSPPGSRKEAVVCGVYSWRLRPENRNPEERRRMVRGAPPQLSSG